MEWILKNKEWLFSGAAVAIPVALISWIVGWFISSRDKQQQKGGDGSINIQVGGNVNVYERNEHKNE